MPRDLNSPRYRRLRELMVSERKARGLTQASVAKALGRPQSYVADIERRERRIDIIEYLALADVIGFNPGMILSQVSVVESSPEIVGVRG